MGCFWQAFYIDASNSEKDDGSRSGFDRIVWRDRFVKRKGKGDAGGGGCCAIL